MDSVEEPHLLIWGWKRFFGLSRRLRCSPLFGQWPFGCCGNLAFLFAIRDCLHGDLVVQEDGLRDRRPWHAYDLGMSWQAFLRLIRYRAMRVARQ